MKSTAGSEGLHRKPPCSATQGPAARSHQDWAPPEDTHDPERPTGTHG